MFRNARNVLLAFGLALVPSFAQAQDSSVRLPQDIIYKSPFVGYPQVAVVYEDPTKAGIYVQRVRFAPGFKIMPHWHPDEVRTVVVLSGTLHFAYGDKWDESKLQVYPTGTFFSEPPRAPHYAWAKDGEVIVQITGTGPSGVIMLEQAKN